MNKFNLKKATFAELRKKYRKILKVENTDKFCGKFNSLQTSICNELYIRQRKAIFNYCRKTGCLKNLYNTNYFYWCSYFATKCINSDDIFCDDEHYEINSFYCKNNRPHVVFFD